MPNVADLFAPNVTTEVIQDAMYGHKDMLPENELYGENWVYQIYQLILSDCFQGVQSPCLTNDTIWTKANQSSTLELQRLLLLHADPDPSGARHFTVENTTAPAECVYNFDVPVIRSLMIAMWEQAFNGTCGAFSTFSGAENVTSVFCDNKYWPARFCSDNGNTADRVIKQFEDFTDRLSNKLRMEFLNKPESAPGQVLQETVCSRIRYSWLAFPAVLLAVTSDLLAWTMFRNSRRQGREMVWKSSILPFLFYGDRFVVQNGEDVSAYSTESSRRDEAEPLLDLDRMETEARQRVVRFNVFE